MHCAAGTIFIFLASQTSSRFRPATVPHHLKPVVPYFRKVVGVNIPLHKIPVDIRTCRYGAVYQYGSDIDSRTAEKI
jgi:hypothetical protein